MDSAGGDRGGLAHHGGGVDIGQKNKAAAKGKNTQKRTDGAKAAQDHHCSAAAKGRPAPKTPRGHAAAITN